MANKITYSDVDRTLVSLGFEAEAVEGSHRIFRHPRKKSVIILPYRRLSEPVDRTRLAMVRQVPISTNVVAPEVFKDLFFEHVKKNGAPMTKFGEERG